MSVSGHLPVEGGSLWFEVEGSGPAVTLLHAGVAHLRMWDEQVPALASRHRVVRYDARGFGRSRSEDVEFSNRDDLAHLLDHLGIQETHMVGLSRGATIALDFTLERSERVTGLVLAGGVPSGFEHADPLADAMWAEEERLYEARDWAGLVEHEVRIWVDGPGQLPSRVDPSVRERMVRWGLETYHADPGHGRPRPLEPAAAERLGEVRVPTLVTWGDLDEAGVLAGCEVLATGIVGARRHVFPGVAHMVNLERPAEFASLVLDFLAPIDKRARTV